MTDAELIDPIPLCTLQHWAYSPRPCALIHLEQACDDKLLTLPGNALHTRVDQPGLQTERGRRVERALPLWHDTQAKVTRNLTRVRWVATAAAPCHPPGVRPPVASELRTQDFSASVAQDLGSAANTSPPGRQLSSFDLARQQLWAQHRDH